MYGEDLFLEVIRDVSSAIKLLITFYALVAPTARLRELNINYG